MASGDGAEDEKSFLKNDMCLWFGTQGRLDGDSAQVLYVRAIAVAFDVITNVVAEEEERLKDGMVGRGVAGDDATDDAIDPGPVLAIALGLLKAARPRRLL